MKQTATLLLLLGAHAACAQKWKGEDKTAYNLLQQHVQYLADDALEGRRTGTAGEQKAAAYISSQFAQMGLQPKGDSGFLQTFPVQEGRRIGSATLFTVDGKSLALQHEFFPLAISSSGSVEALPSLALQEPGTPWFWDLKEILEANGHNPHFDVQNAVLEKAIAAKTKGATALLVYNSTAVNDGLRFDVKQPAAAAPLPVVYLTKAATQKFFSDASATLDVKLKVEWAVQKRTGTNVVAFIDNGAPTTIVLGAHFDHLGYGEDGNSRETGPHTQVHNGADDNASGTAALLELARRLNKGKLRGSNFLLVAFSGEELGLFGSKYFTEHAPLPLNNINYMVNMDMVGRLSDSSSMVTVGGFGTSPQWGALYAVKGKKGLYAEGLQFRFDSSGRGPSDHTSFYQKDIPVLFYFTGLHTDYHKPTDDWQKINFNGELRLVKHIYSLLEATDKKGQRLAFTKTREAQTTTSARWSVSLGIMPDYTFSGAGVRVDGVSEGKPAQKSGLQAGDIIIRLGPTAITSMESYMQALSQFKKGDKTTLEYKRKEQAQSVTVEF